MNPSLSAVKGVILPLSEDASADDLNPHAESRLFQPIRVGKVNLTNRVVLAPLTRYRASKAHVPTDFQVEYYAQRASVPGTLLISEATFISPNAGGSDYVPGIWSEAQVKGWKKVTDAVHARKSFIYLQLWATGRVAEPDILASNDEESNPGGPYPLVAPSSIPLTNRPSTEAAPRALTVSEIGAYIAAYATAAKNAIRAGFDGVEIHGAHGYLIDQFIQSNSNQREDEWGGSVAGRCKFALAVVDAVVAAVGAERTGLRLSPWCTIHDMRMPTNEAVREIFSYIVRSIRDSHPNFAFIHCPEPRELRDFIVVDRKPLGGESNDFLFDIWLEEGGSDHDRVYITAGGYTAESALKEVEKRDKVLVAFGRHYISTPDLPARIQRCLPFTPYVRDTFYVPESAVGYTDYGFADSKAEANYLLVT